MTEERWVIDATLHSPGASLAFCPINEDGAVVTGLSLITDRPPGEFVGVFHEDGQEAAEAWAEANKELLNELVGKEEK